MIKKLIYNLLCFRLNYVFKRKLRILMKATRRASEMDKAKEYENYWKTKRLYADKSYYHLYSSISKNPSPYYVPENFYYTHLESALNNRSMLKAYSNKNIYERIYEENFLFPRVYLRSINGIFYTEDYRYCKDPGKLFENKELQMFIIKIALDSGGGRGVELFARKDNEYISNNGFVWNPARLISRFGPDFVIQEHIKQHDFFKRFNGSSLNTIRIFTYRSVVNEDIQILHSILRIGQPGSIVDNQASGGLSCGIKNKRLNTFAIDKSGSLYSQAGDYHFEEGLEVPFYDQLLVEAKKIASQNHYARILGLDFCIDNTCKVRLLEVNNSNNEINFYQMNNGPLFGEFTNEIVDWCLTQPKTVCLDFSVTY